MSSQQLQCLMADLSITTLTVTNVTIFWDSCNKYSTKKKIWFQRKTSLKALLYYYDLVIEDNGKVQLDTAQ